MKWTGCEVYRLAPVAQAHAQAVGMAPHPQTFETPVLAAAPSSESMMPLRGSPFPEPGAQGTPAFEPPDIPVPVLPDDALRMIWGIVRVSQAACIIQHAVRAAIARAAGDPWDLPGLSPVHVTYDESWAPTHTRTHHHIITSSPCRWWVWSHHQRDRLLWSETAWQAYN
jgi:hypothetical protein